MSAFFYARMDEQTTKDETRANILGKFKPKERKAWAAYLENGFKQTEAYISVTPSAQAHPEKDFRSTASKFFRKIKDKIGQENLLDAYDLGVDRVFRELEKGLNALYTKYYQNISLGNHTDNTNRQRARELLAKINGMDKSSVNVNHSGAVGSVHLYLPDNGRDRKPDGGVNE